MNHLFAHLGEVRVALGQRDKTDAECDRLADLEDDALLAIARHRSGSVGEFCAKLKTFLEDGDGTGLFGTGRVTKAFRRAIGTELGRLFDGSGTDPIAELVAERKEIAALIESIEADGARLFDAVDAQFPNYRAACKRDAANGTISESGGHPDRHAHHNAMIAAGVDDYENRANAASRRQYDNECKIARRKIRSFAAAAAVAPLLQYEINGDEPLGIINDDNFARIARNLAAFLAPPAAEPIAQTRKAA